MAAGGGPEGLQEMEEDTSIRGGRERDLQRKYRGGVACTGSCFLSHNHPKHVLRDSVFLSIKWGLVEVPAEKAMATHSSTLAWKIPWAEEPGRLQSMGSFRVGHN